MREGQKNCRSWYVFNNKWFVNCFLLSMLLILSACDSPLLVPEAWRPQQPTSPLIPGANTVLAQTVWQIMEVTQNSEPIAIDAVQPVFVTFTSNGYLLARSPKCFSNSYVIGVITEYRYRLRSAGAPGDCDELLRRQSIAISKALLETREYELQDTNLILRGKEVQIVLTSLGPLIPGTNTVLAENRWRLIEVTDQSGDVGFEALSPVYIDFDIAGILHIFAGCPAGAYRITAQSDYQYELTQSMFSAVDCGETVNKQFDGVHNALKATTQYAIQDNQLFLTGDNVRIILEIDNVQ